MTSHPDCIFCKIVAGTIPCHKIWEDSHHLAFLTLWPNTEGFSVVIPKTHHSSYLFEQSDKVINEIVAAAKQVALLLDSAFDDVGRTGMIFEGFGVDHLHAKLVPMHGTKTSDGKWQQRKSDNNTFFDQYAGYISSHDAAQMDDARLKVLAEKIRAAR